MKNFKHYDANSVEETLSILAEYKDKAKICAGGTALLDVMKRRILPSPEVVVNIKNIPGMNEITEDEQGLKIGPLVTLSDVEKSSLIKSKYGILSQTAALVATPAIRNMGTIVGNLIQHVRCWYYLKPDFNCYRKGGSICFASSGDNRYHAIMEQKVCVATNPSDMAIALAVLNAKLQIQNTEGQRDVELKDFFITLGNTLNPEDMITSIIVPNAPLKGMFKKSSYRKAIDFAIVSAASATTDKGNLLALGGVAPIPIIGTTEEVNSAIDNATPLSMNKYKVQIAKTLIKEVM
jgi:xanthine dehydrogenase YagS FAD-binding subunit